MPANLTILHHFSVSLATNLLISAVVIDIGSTELGKPCVQHRITKGRFDFPIELLDNCGGRVLGRPTRFPRNNLITGMVSPTVGTRRSGLPEH
jgi:hypothetical protein